MAVQHSALTGADLHEPKGVATATSGQVYVADGAGSGTWQNPLSDVNNLNTFDMNGVIEDVSTANSSYKIRVGRDCTLTNILAVMDAAITVADASIAIYIDGILQGQSLSVPYTGSGDGVKLALNLAPTYTLTSGQVLELESNGASTDTCKLYFTCKFTAD